MYDSARPELQAFRELETLVRHLGDELATFRRRALSAEARLRELDAAEGEGRSPDTAALQVQVTELERENAMLRARLETATQRARQMYERVHFLRQQAQQGPTAGGER